MKKLFLSIAVITFIVGTVSVSYGQEPMEPMKMEKKTVVTPQQKMQGTQVDTVADFESLNKASELRFTENEKLIADLKSKNTSMDANTKSEKIKDIELLEQKNNNLRNDLSSYKKDGKKEWKAFRKQFDSDMDKLTEDLKNMKNPVLK